MMRGMQVAQALSKRGYDASFRMGPAPFALSDLRNSIIVCIKSSPLFSHWLRWKGNRIVYDAIDFTAFRGIPAAANAVIAGTEEMRAKLGRSLSSQTAIKTIYHHADPELKPHQVSQKECRLVYIGEPESSAFLHGEIPELHLVSFHQNPGWREEIRNYNAHFSARMDPTKSVIKLANVAALQAVFLTGAEPGCVELLGKDYPFYLRDPLNLEKVREDVKRLKESIGTTEWNRAREMIETARSKLTLEATAQAYEDLISEI